MEDKFLVKAFTVPKTKHPVLIQGLPGIGNVGKIAVEFMITHLGAEKVYDILGPEFPNAVFVNEQDLVDLPRISIYYKKMGKTEVFFVNGDVQPSNEVGCYTLAQKVLSIAEKHHVKEVISLGGIGLDKIPEAPIVFAVGNDPVIVKKYKSSPTHMVYGTVGPIIGMAGILVGLAKDYNIPGAILLAETFAHPTHIGIKGAREIIRVLNTKIHMGVNINELDKEIKSMEKNIKTPARTIVQPALAPKEEKPFKDYNNYIG